MGSPSAPGPPQVAPGFGNIMPWIRDMMARSQGGLDQVQQGFSSGKFGGPNVGAAEGLQGQVLGAMSGQGGVGQGFQAGMQQLMNTAGGGAGQNLFDQAQSMMQPANQRAFERGQADIFETNSALGIPLTSTSTGQMATDLQSSIQSGSQQQLAQMIPQLFGQQTAAAGALAGMPSAAAGIFSQPLQQQFGAQMAGMQLPGQVAGMGQGMLQELPMWQQGASGPGKGEQLMQMAVPIATSYFTGGAGGAGKGAV